jgi:hypothetical protein
VPQRSGFSPGQRFSSFVRNEAYQFRNQQSGTLVKWQPWFYLGLVAHSFFCAQLNSLNPYDTTAVEHILKIEKCNYDENGDPQQLYGVAVFAKRYVVYRRNARKLEIIKPSEHGLGIVYVPDERSQQTLKNQLSDTRAADNRSSR